MTGADGRRHARRSCPGDANTIVVDLGRFASTSIRTRRPDRAARADVHLDMPALDQAVADGAAVDLTQPFFPFGPQPQPGAAFYFSPRGGVRQARCALRIYVQPDRRRRRTSSTAPGNDPPTTW